MKAYKATDSNMQCRDFQFEIGVTYKVDGALAMCGNGFHCCRRLFDVQKYYNPTKARFFEVCIGTEWLEEEEEGDKLCAREITLVRELTFAEVMAGLNLDEKGQAFELGKNTNLGFGNQGNYNKGNSNNGNNNKGNYNTGNFNIGNYNAGNSNAGNSNIGKYNAGNYNNGNYNQGNYNNGNYNNGNLCQ